MLATEPPWRKHALVKSGQTWLMQFWGRGRTVSRSAFANATASLASTLGANHGNATTEAPKTANTAKAERDLIIGLLTVGRANPASLGDRLINNSRE